MLRRMKNIVAKIVKNERGSSLVGSLVVMTVLAAASAAVVNISGGDIESTMDDMQVAQVSGVVNAGFQSTLDKINQGENGDVTDMEFGPGKFSVVTDPMSDIITVTGEVGKAKKTQSINVDFADDTVDMYLTGATVEGSSVTGIQFVMNGTNDAAILSALTVSLDQGSCAIDVSCDGSTTVTVDDDDDADDDADDDDGDDDDDDGDGDDDDDDSDGHSNNGHGNNCDGVDSSNPGQGNGGPNGEDDASGDVDDECGNDDDDDGDDDDDDDDGDNDDDGDDDVADDEGEDDDDDDDSEGSAQATCELTAESESLLSDCIQDDGGIQLKEVLLADTYIYKAGSIPSGECSATSSDEETDVEDVVMTDGEPYEMELVFDEDIPVGTWMSITAHFADGSDVSGTFKVGDEAAADAAEDVDSGEKTAEDTSLGFTVDDGIVTVAYQQTVELLAIGSAITCGAGGPEVSVNAKLCINSECTALWDSADIDGEETYTTTTTENDSEFTIEAHAYSASCGNFSKTYSSTNTVQVKSLVDGDDMPMVKGFAGQKSVKEFLDLYIVDGKIELDVNQVIVLFELGTTATTNSAAADFQDLVILMTITDE